MQKDLKRLIAYSSISHLGFVVLGIFVFTIQGLSGGTFQMISHGLSTGALFLLVGMLYERRHTREISDFGGLATAAPVYAGLFLIVALSSLGLPGLNGFVGEFLVILGAFARNRVWAVIAATGVIFAAIYLLWAYQRVFHGPLTIEENRLIPDVTLREAVALVPLVGLIILMGVWPKPFLERMEPSLERVRARVVQQEPVASLQDASPGTGG
jgi:NADH-quinone oxidoreductase subunit M